MRHSGRPRAGAALLLLTLATFAAPATPPGAPDLRTLDGKPFSLESLRGNVVVLDFWAPWCVPCRASFPALDALQHEHGSRGLRVVGLTLEPDDRGVRAFLDAVRVSFTIARDPSGAAGTAFDVVAMPTTFLLDREGRVAARFEGGDRQVHARLEEAVEALLSGGALPASSGVRVAEGLRATGSLKAWERTYLADPILSLDGDPLTRFIREHVHASKEAAAGNGGASGGGCGCN